jgi:hypothetical protein
MHPIRRQQSIRLATALALTGLAVAASPALAAAPSVRDIDAELVGSQLHLETETAGATKVTFRFAGRSAVGRLTDIDHEDGTRDFERFVKAGGIKPGRRAITVRACGADGCTTRTATVFIERDDD